jgi:AcrR family transcriptional regulator
MSRVTKDPQIRIAEIIGVAEELFNARGYQETQISDIVKAIGVAQGTFYYYFKSKEEVVEAIVRRKVDRILGEVEEITAIKELAAPRKLSVVINTAINGIRGRDGLLFEYLYCDQNLHILDKLGHQAGELFGPALKKVIAEGIGQGCFHVAYPEETVEFIIAIIRVVIDSLYEKETAERQALRLEITQKLIETALGAAPGTIDLSE